MPDETYTSGPDTMEVEWVHAPTYECSGCHGKFVNVFIDSFVLGRYWCPSCFDEEYGPDEYT